MRLASIIITLWLTVASASAQEAKQETIPLQPRVVEAAPDIVIGQPLPRPDTREVWQYYGVNRFGRFVPRVIMTPGGMGGYYYRNFEAYPWVQSRPSLVMPYAAD